MPDLTPVQHLANVICPDRSEGGSPHGVCVAKARVLLEDLCASPGVRDDLARVIWRSAFSSVGRTPPYPWTLAPEDVLRRYRHQADAVLAWLDDREAS